MQTIIDMGQEFRLGETASWTILVDFSTYSGFNQQKLCKNCDVCRDSTIMSHHELLKGGSYGRALIDEPQEIGCGLKIVSGPPFASSRIGHSQNTTADQGAPSA